MTCFETIEADLTRYYGIDLPDALWGDQPMSARRLGVLIKGLPADSGLVQETTHGWGTQEELLACLLELTDLGNRWFYSAHSKPGTRALEPIVIPRPGRAQPDPKPPEPRRSMSTPEQIRRAGGKFVHAPKATP